MNNYFSNMGLKSIPAPHTWPNSKMYKHHSSASEQSPDKALLAAVYICLSQFHHELTLFVGSKCQHFIWITNHSRSRQVPEHIGIRFVPLEIVSSDKILNPLFDCLEIRLEHAAQLLDTLQYQLLVPQNFPTFHNAHN